MIYVEIKHMNKNTKITIDLNAEKISIYDGKINVGELGFLLDETQIIVSDITVIDEKRGQGYGCLMLHTIKGISEFFKKPIYLISNPDKIRFYEKMEFFSMDTLMTTFFKHDNIKVNIKNLNPQKPIKEQLSMVDMLWIPNNMKEVDVYL
jgi:hypothetical protein